MTKRKTNSDDEIQSPESFPHILKEIRGPSSTDRKSVLDSLVKRRREIAEKSKYFDTPFDSSQENESGSSEDDDDNFVVSDSSHDESCSSETSSSENSKNRPKKRRTKKFHGDSSSSDEPSSDDSMSSADDSFGFYARVSSLIDKKREKLNTVADTMSPRQAFQLCMQYYAMCLVSRNCEYPKHSENKKLNRILPELQLGVRRIERELMSRRDNIRPSYWKDESVFVRAIHRYPRLEKIDHRKFWEHKYDQEPCAACHRMGWSWELRFRGDAYDSRSLWKGNIRDWLKAMDLPLVGKAKHVGGESESENSDERNWTDDDPEVSDFVSRRIEVGTQCASNVEIFHALQHSKNYFMRKIYDFIVNQNLEDSLTNVVRTFKDPKNHFVGKLYDAYNELIQLSESRFEIDDDEGPVDNIKIASKDKRRQSNRF